MISQYEMRKYMRLQRLTKEFDKYRDSIKPRMLDKEKQEAGPLVMTITPVQISSVSYKSAIERIKELHPDMSGPVSRIVEANTKPVTQHQIHVTPA